MEYFCRRKRCKQHQRSTPFCGGQREWKCTNARANYHVSRRKTASASWHYAASGCTTQFAQLHPFCHKKSQSGCSVPPELQCTNGFYGSFSNDRATADLSANTTGR